MTIQRWFFPSDKILVRWALELPRFRRGAVYCYCRDYLLSSYDSLDRTIRSEPSILTVGNYPALLALILFTASEDHYKPSDLKWTVQILYWDVSVTVLLERIETRCCHRTCVRVTSFVVGCTVQLLRCGTCACESNLNTLFCLILIWCSTQLLRCSSCQIAIRVASRTGPQSVIEWCAFFF